MSTLSYAVRDSTTMLRRDIRHSLRNPMMTISGVGLPVIFLLLFVGVFGHSLRAGLGSAIPVGGGYVDYLIPGILVMTAASCAEMTAIEMSTDKTEGIVTRFRAMAITRASVLTGRVAGSVIRTLVSGALLVAVGLALGFRPSATPIEWVAVMALFALLALALSWITVAFGLLAKTPAGANSLSLIVVVLPFISSAFVPTGAMPAGVRWVAQNQPFTPIIQSLRGLLTGVPIGNSAILAAAWCAAIAAGGYLWARTRYDRGR